MRALLCAALLLFATPAWAANHYVRAAASGTANGTDWTNACTDFTGSCAVSSLVRGDSYYVGTGTYAARTFNTTNSAALVITIIGATAAVHGADTGWSDAFSVSLSDGGAQATWSFSGSANITITTDHWIVDGSVGTSNSITSYGFLLAKPGDCTVHPQKHVSVIHSGTAQTDVTIKHVALSACGDGFDSAQVLVSAGCGNCYLTNLTVANTYSTKDNTDLNLTNVSTSTFERNYWENHLRFPSAVNAGKEVIAVNNCHNSDVGGCTTLCTQGLCATSDTFRYNVVKNTNVTGFTGGIIGLGPGNALALLSWDIYGNIFVDCGGNSGCIAGTNNFAAKTVNVYNNTFASSTVIFRECDNHSAGCASASGNVVENNLLWNSASNIDAFQGGAITADYNSFLSATDTPPSETHGQVVTLNPFVNAGAGDYHLAIASVASCASIAATCTGLTLAAPYATDLDGNTRGGDGAFERGAFEFVVGGSSAGPAAPPRGFLMRPGGL